MNTTLIISSFVPGILTVLTPCVLPVSFMSVFFYLGIYVLGLMISFGTIGIFAQKIISKLGRAANPKGIFKRGTDLLLMLVGFLIISGYSKTIEAKILNSKYNLTHIQTAPMQSQYQEYSSVKRDRAQEKGYNYALFFHANWCSTCLALEKKILNNREQLPRKTIIFKVNYDKKTKLRRKLKVLTLSTLIFFNPKGEEIDRAINPTLQRIIKDLAASSPQKKSEGEVTTAELEKIKSKKNFFSTAKEYYAFLLGNDSLKQATFAGGCFWCIEGPLEAQKGVVEVFSGYAGGKLAHPTYQQVSRGNTGAREAVDVFYDPKIISFKQLMQIYWRQINPSDAGGQFADRGFQYTTAIFYRNAQEKRQANLSKRELETSEEFPQVATKILPYKIFSLAEQHQQDYYKKQADHYNRYKKGSGRYGNIKRNKKAFDKIFADGKIKARAKYKRPDQSKIKSMLGSSAYAVTQKGATERPFKNAYWDNHRVGIYVDVVTGEPLFASTDKFKSGTGWPSFTRPIDNKFITEKEDNTLFMSRTEVKSKVGNSHLGHVFNDGPKDRGGRRYCINSAALRFIPLSEMEKRGYGQYLSLFQ